MEIFYGILILGIEFFLFPIFIGWARRKQFGQYIRPEGPDLHGYKQGTPTAGGIIFVPTVAVLNLVGFLFLRDFVFVYVAIAALLFGLIGFFDDFSSILKKEAMGLTAKRKFMLQLLLSVVLLLFFENAVNGNFFWYVPGSDFILRFNRYFYFFVYVFLFTGFSNATNLTDGLDGLAGGNFIVSAAFTILIAVLKFNAPVYLIFAVVLPVVVFLFFNAKPAQVFMGDTGSLALGGILSAIATYYHIELFLIFTGIVFIVETLSVIIQVSSFKLRGKRVFLMSPIHHHFELKKWPEENITFRFILVGFFFSVVALML
ncbi:phospho-N-acetylmuramoyl-pentapeptide-transferase [Marinitoga piezophila KA3]|uniref:Phospho-N-acetylmuramoyl-pentapeptide-transferase n=1 Tax=Marinitoga piezophila (strain DSM 14283 / JCM 11233 / KA3) TaxID=443254 RepID=H2J8D2_MARPK|nr:phospho-N-acetylmuramoyl-pentapeptide-transferase [Marinitoga piezophila]AEX85616.1 phospho-N-acetylmuramoyl-pentapeptide-transferase [Marinitoga piezophila KA3]